MIKPKTKQLASDETAPVTKFQFSPYQVNKLYHNNNDIIDFVTNGKSLYVCIVDGTVTSHANIDDESGFLKLVSQGAQGDPGARGDDGRPGNTPNLTFKFIDKQLLISENGVVKVASPDLAGPAWRPVLRGDNLDWELSKDKTVPQSIDLHDLTAPERPILLRTNSDNTKRDDEESGPANFIQWKYEGDAEWTNLISISELLNLALAGVSFWPDNDGYWHFGHKEVIRATYSSDDSGRDIISDVELGDVLFDAGKIPFANYELDIEAIKDRLTVLEGKPDVNLDNYYTKNQSDTRFQPLGNYLTSHQPLKTINGQSLVGNGNITIEGGSGETPDLEGYATEAWVNNQKFVKKVNNIAPDANGNVTLSIVGNPIVSIKIENNKLYKKNANDTGWIEIGSVGGTGGGDGLTEAQVKALIGNALEGTNIPDQYIRSDEHNYFIRLNDLTVALGNYYTKAEVYTKGQVDALINGDANTYRVFMIFKRSANPNSETLPTTAITWNISTGVLDIPEGSNGWTEHPENATTAAPYLWMASATFESLTGERTGNWDGPFCLTGERGSDGSDGNGVEFIYTLVRNINDKVNVVRPVAPAGSGDDDYPTGWEDHPQGIGYYYPSQVTTTLTNLPNVETLFGLELASIRKYDGVTEQWGAYSQPFIWSMWGEDGIDGDGVEYIFCVTAEPSIGVYANDIPLTDAAVDNLGPAYQVPDWLPTNSAWTDNPLDVDEQQPYEWVSVRKYNGVTEKWGKFSEPKVWGLWGQKTITNTIIQDGTTYYKPYTCYAFTRTNVDISNYSIEYTFNDYSTLTPEQKSAFYDNPLNFIKTLDENNNIVSNITWYDTVPSTSGQLWLITNHIGDEGDSSETGWNGPTKWGDQAGFQIEYALSDENSDAVYAGNKTLPSLNNFKDNSLETVDEANWRLAAAGNLTGYTVNCGTWADDVEDPVYMATAYKKGDGNWSDWTVAKIKGEKGDKGDSNYFIETNQELFTFSANENGVLVEPVDPVSCKYTLKYGKASISDSDVVWSIHRTDEFVVWDGRTSSTQKKITYTGVQVDSDEAPRSDCLYKWVDSEANNFYTNTLVLNSTSRIFDANQNQWTYYGIPSNVTGLTISNGTLYGTLSNFLKDQVLINVSATHAGVTTNKIITFQKIRQGSTGPKGVSGVPYFFRGNWESDEDYFCNQQRIDIVKNGDHYYICQQQHQSSSNNEPTWNSSLNRMNENPYWVAFEGEFTNIATDFIFARQALIDRLELNFADVNGVLCANRIVANSNCTGESQSGDESLIDYIDRKSSQAQDVVLNLSNDYQQIQIHEDSGVLKVAYDQVATTNLVLYKGTTTLPIDDVEVNVNNNWVSISNQTIYNGTLTQQGNNHSIVDFSLSKNTAFPDSGSSIKIIQLRAKRTVDGETYYGYHNWVIEATENDVYNLLVGTTQLILDDNDEIINTYDGTSTANTYHLTEYSLRSNIAGGPVLSTDKYVMFFKWDDENVYYSFLKNNDNKYVIKFKSTNSGGEDDGSLWIHKHYYEDPEGILIADTVSGWADENHKTYTVYAYAAKYENGGLITEWSEYENNGVLIDYETTPIIRNGSTYSLECNYSVIPMASNGYTSSLAYSITAGVYQNGTLVTDAVVIGVAHYAYSRDGAIAYSNINNPFTSTNGLLTISSSDIDNDSSGDCLKKLEITATYNNTNLHTTLGVVYNGNNGENAVPYVYRGEWDSILTYTKNDQQIDVVKHEGVYYMCADDDNIGNEPGTDDDEYWTPFRANFENVATGLLLAERASIDNLYVDTEHVEGVLTANKIDTDNLIVSHLQTTDNTGKGVVISDNVIRAFDEDGNYCVKISGDSINANNNYFGYLIPPISWQSDIKPASGTVLTHYDDLSSVFPVTSNQINVTVDVISLQYILESRGLVSGTYQFVLRRGLGGDNWEDIELWPNSTSILTIDGQWHNNNGHQTISAQKTGLTIGIYKVALKLVVNYAANAGYREIGIKTGQSHVSVGTSTSMLVEIGSNGAKFDLGSDCYAEFINDPNNGRQITIQSEHGDYGIKINSTGLYFKTSPSGNYTKQT